VHFSFIKGILNNIANTTAEKYSRLYINLFIFRILHGLKKLNPWTPLLMYASRHNRVCGSGKGVAQKSSSTEVITNWLSLWVITSYKYRPCFNRWYLFSLSRNSVVLWIPNVHCRNHRILQHGSVVSSDVTTGWRGFQNAKGPGPTGVPLGPPASELKTLKYVFLQNIIIKKYIFIRFLYLMEIVNVFCC
jgi:hypothetical protein